MSYPTDDLDPEKVKRWVEAERAERNYDAVPEGDRMAAGGMKAEDADDVELLARALRVIIKDDPDWLEVAEVRAAWEWLHSG